MLSMNCITCNSNICLIHYEWETKTAIICNNPNLSDEEKEKEKTKLLLSFNFRLCCNARIMTYKDTVYDIIPIKKENSDK